MRRSNRGMLALAAALLLPAALVALAPGADAAKKKKADRFFHPQYASFGVQSVGLLPVMALMPIPQTGRGRDEDALEIVRRHVERALRPSGYRFQGEDELHSAAKSAQAEQVLETLEASWRKSGELDTTALKALGDAKVVDAVLGTMITTWNRQTIDPAVTGRSITEIAVLLSLYSTRTGELLWRDTFLEKGEGPYNNAGMGNVIGVQGSAIGNTAMTATSLDPPSFEEVAVKLEKKMSGAFPPLPKAEAKEPPPAPGGAKPDSAAKSGS